MVSRKRRRSEEAWKRRNSRFDRAGETRQRQTDKQVTYFFTQFPDNHGAKEMFRIFSMYGEATEVVIPAKRDKIGRRFGFVRFRGVRDVDFFATKLDNIIIGATKMHVNIPRFSRDKPQPKTAPITVGRDIVNDTRAKKDCDAEVDVEDKRGKKVMVEAQNCCDHLEQNSQRVNNYRARNGENARMFNRNRRRGGLRRDKQKKEAHKGLLCYDVGDEEMNRFRKMYVGYVKQSGTSYMMQEWINMQGVFSIKITPIGANSVLMEDIEEGAIENAIKEGERWLYDWFVEVSQWQPFVRDAERLTWIRCHGIPPHAWGEGICKLMANTLGSYVDIDEDTRMKTSYDVARVLIRSRTLGVINEVMHVTINGEVFPIKLVEEWCGPLRWPILPNSPPSCSEADSDDSRSDFDGDPPLFPPEEVADDDGLEVVEETPRIINCADLVMAKDVGNNKNVHVEAAGVTGFETRMHGEKEINDYVGLRDSNGQSVIGVENEENKERERNDQKEGETELRCKNTVKKVKNNNLAPPLGPVDKRPTNLTSLVRTSPSEIGPSHQKTIRPKKIIVRGPVGPGPSNWLNQNQLSSSGSSVAVGVVRNEIGAFLPSSLSSSVAPPSASGSSASSFSSDLNINDCSKDSRSTHFSGGSVLCEASIGDSDIQRCNDRVWVDHQVQTANKTWNFAKSQLGVTGNEDDSVYVNAIRDMELRDQDAKNQRESSKAAQ